ncbi:unnamed protein product, partial [Ectocarpus sp. 6 AP-2014]
TRRDISKQETRSLGPKGYKISAISGAELGVLPASAKKAHDVQADVWLVGSRQEAANGFEGVDDATKKLTTATQDNDNSFAKIAEEADLAGVVKRLTNLSIEETEKGSQREDASDDEDAALTVAEVAQAAAALADAVAAAVAEAGTGSGSPAVCQNDHEYEWLCAQLDTPCWRASTLADFTTDGRLPESGVSEAT